MKTQSRWTSPVMWAAIAAQILAILVLTGVMDAGQSDAINVVVAAVLQLLVTFGVMNNPTAAKKF